MRIGKGILAVVALVVMLIASSCSTTRRLGEDEILYTGVKKIDISSPKGTKIPGGLKSSIKDAVNVKPNNSLYSPYVRWPFPLGLWVYNNWDNPPSGFKHWLYEKLVAEPVLISDVRPEVRVKMIDELLDNSGYFQGHAAFKLIQGSNKKKARITYEISTGPVYPIDSIILLPDTCHLNHVVDSVARKLKYLRPGSPFSTDSLSDVRVRIANVLRNRGYYFFKPDFIEYLADSTIHQGSIALRLNIAANIPDLAARRYRTGTITTHVNRNQGGGTPDTIHSPKGDIIVMRPARLRQNLIPSCIAFRPGATFSVRDMNRTQNYLSRLGIFNGIYINALPDSVAPDVLNVDIDCTFDAPLETSIEVNATSKSNSYIGPGLDLKVSSKNLFGGGEQLSVGLRGSYEWQTGKQRGSVFNSYEVGLNASLSFPRLLAPRFIPRSRRDLNWTRIDLGIDLMNRPHYFRLAQFNTSFGYDWQVSRHVSSTLTLLKLTYTKLIHTTHEFDSIMAENPVVAQSFRSQFIPQMIYQYQYDRKINKYNQINWQFSIQEAGNVFWSIYELAGKHGEKNLFGTPFSQFVKGTSQFVWNWRMRGDSWLVSRVAVGAAHAYGNSTQVPYSEQFYVGGANSIRAFTVRSLGPGSYKPNAKLANSYFDQTGTFKFEFNVEYRFPIISIFHGAVFLDTGNIWLLKNDPLRPGGLLKASTFFKDLAVGTGVGLRVDVGMLVVRGDLGIGLHAPYDTGRHGYFNMPSFKRSLAFHLAIGYPF